MNDLLKKCSMILLFFVFAIFSVAVSGAQGKEVQQLVCYPTDVAEAGELAYLRDSLRLMLASRIAAVAGVGVRLEQKMVKERDFAFYRMESRLVSSQDGVQLSATAYRPHTESPLHFQSVVSDSAEIMKALDLLVADMGNSLFKENKIEQPSQPAKEAEKQATGKADPGSAHPDRVFKTNRGYGLSIIQEDFISEMAVEVRVTERHRSPVLSFQSQGMTAGDIDGDSVVEILVATHGILFIYQMQDSKMKNLATISLPGGLRVHALNVADLDKNGLMEIYISSTRNKEPRSFVLEWHPATGVKWLHENVFWYLRPLNIPGEGLVLGGQQSGVAGLTEPGIYRLTVQSGEKISQGRQLALPESVNLFDFVFADLDGDQLSEIVSMNKKEELQVFSSDSQLLYTSPSGFSGRELSQELTVPIRLVVFDFDADGHGDIFVVDNELSSPKMLSKTRLYKNGQVRGLSWDGNAFYEMWSTNIFKNAVVDFQFLPSVTAPDSEGNGKGSLFVIEPEKGDFLQSFLLGGGGSRLAVYGMEFVPQKNAAEE